MSTKTYQVHFTERWNIGGQKFTHTGDHSSSKIVECLASISKQAISLSSHDNPWDSIWAKQKRYGEYVDRIDYRGVPGYLSMGQPNPAVLILEGHWSGIAHSKDHIAPYISLGINFSAPPGEAITDLDAYHILTWMYVRKYNVEYKPDMLPGKRYWWRESNKTVKKNAEGLTFPPPFIRS